ncbi:MAG: YpmS family protein [Bacillota bacterium]|nr:YpmS family protein [Bacillota bacterium]
MMKNKWKKGFFLLLGIDLFIVILILLLIMVPSEKGKKQINKTTNGDVSFYIKSNKRDVNRLVNHYLKKEAANTPINYQVNLGNEVELFGMIPFFGEKLDLKLSFEPQSMANGDLELKQKSISLGSLHLPVPYVLKFISENYKLPSGVEIRSNDKLIYIHMQQLNTKSGIKVIVNKFDLKKDDIAFTILVPAE